MTTEAQKRLADEAERLRTDAAFAAAVKAVHAGANETLGALYASLAEAVVQGLDINSLRLQIVEQRAVIKAVEGLTTEIAGMILRGRTADAPDRA